MMPERVISRYEEPENRIIRMARGVEFLRAIIDEPGVGRNPNVLFVRGESCVVQFRLGPDLGLRIEDPMTPGSKLQVTALRNGGPDHIFRAGKPKRVSRRASSEKFNSVVQKVFTTFQ